MLSYLSCVLTAVAALLLTCHASSERPGIAELRAIPGRDGLNGLPYALGLPVSPDTECHNLLVKLVHRVFQLEAVLALNKKITPVGEKVFATNGKNTDFASALRSCEEAGGTLATPTNEEENKAIMDIVKQYRQYAYLGIRHSETSGQFKAITGRSLSYTNWHQNEPSGKGKEKCVEMYMDGSWNDRKCDLHRLTICEF